MRDKTTEPICLENEIWKDIPDYEGLYQASSLGRIRTTEGKTTFTQRHGQRHWKSRILKGRGNFYETGKRVSLWKNGTPKDWLVARLVAITFLGRPTKEVGTVNHINGNRLDNRIENLEWLSLADNLRHAFDTGLMPYKRVRLYNENCDLIFRSMCLASKHIGRNGGYISNSVLKGRKIIGKDGVEYQVSFLPHNRRTSNE